MTIMGTPPMARVMAPDTALTHHCHFTDKEPKERKGCRPPGVTAA